MKIFQNKDPVFLFNNFFFLFWNSLPIQTDDNFISNSNSCNETYSREFNFRVNRYQSKGKYKNRRSQEQKRTVIK